MYMLFKHAIFHISLNWGLISSGESDRESISRGCKSEICGVYF